MYLDDLTLVAGKTAEVGANLLPGSDFEETLSPPWTVSANLANSGLTAAFKHGGQNSLHVISSSGGITRRYPFIRTSARR